MRSEWRALPLSGLLYTLVGIGACTPADKADSGPTTSEDDTGCQPTEEIPYNGLDEDCDGSDLVDVDGDGWSVYDECDDEDPDIYPGAAEVPYDDIDQDCDGSDVKDVDKAGVPGILGGGADCDDEDPEIHPGMPEVCNEVDDDCDGTIDIMVAGLTHDTVQESLDAACEDNPVVEVMPGTWLENIVMPEQDTILRSQDGTETTILDGSACTNGNDLCSVVSFYGGQTNDSVLHGFTITGGTGTLCELVGSTDVGCGGTRAGGGVFSIHAAPTLSNLVVSDNRLDSSSNLYTLAAGGGIFCAESYWPDEDGDSWNRSIMQLVDSEIANHDLVTGTGDKVSRWGGGVFGWYCDIAYDNSWVHDNKAGNGGGVYWRALENLTSMDNVAVESNHAEGAGGGIYFSYDDICDISLITNTSIKDNEAEITGGGMYVIACTGDWDESNTIEDNSPNDCAMDYFGCPE